MTTTPILGIAEVAPGQDQKETTINDAIVALEAATQAERVVSFVANAATLTAEAFAGAYEFTAGTITAGGTLVVPLIKHTFIVDNRANAYAVVCGGTSGASVSIPAGAAATLRCDGTDVYTPHSLVTTAGVLTLGGVAGVIATGGNIGVTGHTLELSGMAAEAVPDAGIVTSNGTHVASLVPSADFDTSGGTLSLAGIEHTANKDAPNGYAGLDAAGKVAFAQLPNALADALFFAGTWNASTNTPALASATDPNVAGPASVYVVTVAGTTTLDGYSQWLAGDKAIFDKVSGKWERIEGEATTVTSFGGASGTISVSPRLAMSSTTLDLATQAASTLLGNYGTASAGPDPVAIGDGLALSTAGTLSANGSWGVRFAVGVAFSGKPAPGQVVRIAVTEKTVVPANLSGVQTSWKTNATSPADFVFSLGQAGTVIPFGTLTVATSGTLSATPSHAAVTLDPASHDWWELDAPAVPDPTLADGGFTLPFIKA